MKINKYWLPDPEHFLLLFIKWFNEHKADFDVPRIKREECYIVWYNYTLGNAKTLISTQRPDHKYYEMTYDLKQGRVYIDEYLKVSHTIVEKETEND